MNLFISIHLSIYLSIQWSLMIIVYLSLSVTMCLPTNFQYFSCQPALFLSVRWSAFLFFEWCSNQHFARQIAQFLPPLSLWNVYLARQRLSYYIVLSNLYSYTCLYLDHAFILLFFFPCFESDNIVWKSCLDKIWQKFVGSLATKRKLPTQLRICRSYTSFSQELIWTAKIGI